MKSFLAKSVTGIFLLVTWVGNASGQAEDFPYNKGKTPQSQLVDNLLFLNQFDRPLPIEKQVLYKLAEGRLALEPDRGFELLARDNNVQTHLENHHIRMLGGPMLGNVSSSSTASFKSFSARFLATSKADLFMSAFGQRYKIAS